MSSKRNRQRSYEFVVNTKERIKGFTVKGKKMAFGKSGIMVVHDKQLAHDINQQYGCTRTGTRQVIMNDVPNMQHWEPSRRTFWGGWPEMPWKKERQSGEEKHEAGRRRPLSEDEGEAEGEGSQPGSRGRGNR